MCTVSKLVKGPNIGHNFFLFLFQLLLCVVCIVIVMATELRTYVSRFVQLKYVLFLTFLVSFVWNWFYLYTVSSVIIMAFWLRTSQL